MASKPVEVRPTELLDAWADLTYFKAAVELAKKDLVSAQLQLIKAHAALAEARRLTQLCSSAGVADRWARALLPGQGVED